MLSFDFVIALSLVFFDGIVMGILIYNTVMVWRLKQDMDDLLKGYVKQKGIMSDAE